nr:secreted seminal-vesicle Ly-6 protein 1-like [Loxodonta africana]
MSKRLLLLILGLSLLLDFLQALTCHKCFYVHPDGNCAHNRTYCHAMQGQQCILKKNYRGKRLHYGFQGCQLRCKRNMRSIGIYLSISSCCKNKNFCNEL